MQLADPLLLINTFLGKVGMPRQSFDENNAMPLSFDNILIGVHKDDAKNLISITSVIGNLPEQDDKETTAADYNNFLEANLGSVIKGAGAVGVSTEKKLLIYGNAISLIDLTQDAFESFLERSVNTIEDWHVIAKKANALISTQSTAKMQNIEAIMKI